jgi:hypothetical protein
MVSLDGVERKWSFPWVESHPNTGRRSDVPQIGMAVHVVEMSPLDEARNPMLMDVDNQETAFPKRALTDHGRSGTARAGGGSPTPQEKTATKSEEQNQRPRLGIELPVV